MLEIKAAAKKVGLNENTIRYYTDQGLVPDVKRDRHQHRLFDQEALNWLIGDKRLREAGMSIQELKRYVQLCLKGTATVAQRYQIIEQLRHRVQLQLLETKKLAQFLATKAQIYHDIISKQQSDILNPKTWK